ncbi:MAG: hypothetical protein ACLVEJ_24815 [Parabacteroides sp.]
MKVVHIVFGMEYGGIETMLVNIMNEQIKHTDISLIIVNNQEEKSITGILMTKSELQELIVLQDQKILFIYLLLIICYGKGTMI